MEPVLAVIDPEDAESVDVLAEEPVDVLAEESGDVPVEEVEMAQTFRKDSSGTLLQEAQEDPEDSEEPGDRGDKEPGKRINRKGWPIAIIAGVGLGSLILTILWRRRRKNRENSTE